MTTIRSIAPGELGSWLTLSGTVPPDDLLEKRVRAAWEDGGGGPTQTYLAEHDGRPIGRLAWIAGRASSATPDAHEGLIAGLWLPWEAPGAVELGRRLIVETVGSLPDTVFAVDGYANPAYMPGSDVRRAAFEAAGMPLFQEKEGFVWRSDAGGPPPSRRSRLTFRSIQETGGDPFADVMARAVEGTLDRQDRYYGALVEPAGWGREMLTYLEPEDASSWLLAFDGDLVVGYVLLGAFDEPGRATIIHIGVVPEMRGRGYIDELLQAANAAARARSFDRILSDVDVLNPPMLAAMERNGHSAAATPWHVWHFRLERGGRS